MTKYLLAGATYLDENGNVTGGRSLVDTTASLKDVVEAYSGTWQGPIDKSCAFKVTTVAVIPEDTEDALSTI